MAIGFVQGVASSTFGSPVTAGNTVLFISGLYGALPQSVSAVQLGGVSVPRTQQLAFPQTAGAGSPQGVCVYMLPNCPGGGTAITDTNSGSVIATAALEISGAGLAPVVDQSAIAVGATGTIISGSTPATTAANEFVFAAASTYNGSTNAPSQTWASTNIGIGGHLSIGWEEQTTAGHTYAWTQVCGGAIGWAVAVLTIKAGSGLLAVGIA